MSVIAWIVLGLMVGFGASKIVNRTGQGLVLDISLGIAGALVGGLLFQRFGMAGVSEWNLYSLMVSVAGAMVMLFIFHAFVRRNVGSA
jgi:uncharacterized membrane protein YeaQ/YmgE (transglycosylase-associated protein family)